MLNNIDSFKAQVILTVTENQSVSGTARVLKITPSAVSQIIRKVEKDLKRQLFVRVGKKLLPTPFTLDFAELTSKYFRDVDVLYDKAKEKSLKGLIRLGATPIYGKEVLLPLVQEFLIKNPEVQIVLSLKDTKELVSDLLTYKQDVIFSDDGSYLSEEAEIASFPVYEEKLLMCASRKFRGKEDFKVLSELPHVPYHGGKEAIYKWYKHHYGRVPDYSYQLAVDSAEAVYTCIENHLGVGVIPEALIKDAAKIHVIKGRKSDLVNRIVCCQLKGKMPSQAEKSFVNQLK